MKVAPNIAKELAELSRASFTVDRPVLKAGGQQITPAKRDEMLRAIKAGDYVELELELSPAFEQKPGVSNRNFVRFRDGAMMGLGRTGEGKPFLRDHEQGDTLAVGGMITKSRTEKRGEGDYAIHQTVKLTAPWAVELALRGLLSTVSIGWDPTGMVQCSVCGLNFYRCSHYPGEKYAKESGDGDELVVCERIYTAAELLETSAVPVPAVPSARIDEIRAALSLTSDRNSGFRAPEAQERDMNKLPALAAILTLPTTAGEDDVIKAVESLASAKKLVEAQRDGLATELAEVRAKLAGYETVLAKQAEDTFIENAIRSGKLAAGSAFEQALRAYHAKDPEGAKALVASSPVITPVGANRQSGGPLPADTAVNAVDAAIAAAGGDPNKVRADLARAGLKPEAIEKQLAAMVSGKGA